MNPADLIPLAEPIPIGATWFNILLVATFVCHILLMNAVLGASAISLVELLRGRDLDLPERVSKKLPTILALTINFGVAPLLFLQVIYGHFDYVSSVLMGGLWLSLIAVLMGAYYGLYVYDFKFRPWAGARVPVLVFAIACMLFVGFLFSTNMTLMLRPEQWTDYFTEAGATVLNLADPAFWPRWLHFMAAALAVGGLFIALVGKLGNSGRAVTLGMSWFARATMVNILIGIWFLISLPREVMLQFMGGHGLATATLLLALAGAGVIIWTGVKRMVWPSVAALTATVVIMAIARHLLRTFMLAPYFQSSDLEVTGDYASFLFFIGSLALGLPVIAWMIRTYCASGACEGGAK